MSAKKMGKTFFTMKNLFWIIAAGVVTGSFAAPKLSAAGLENAFGNLLLSGGFLPKISGNLSFATGFAAAFFPMIISLTVLALCGFSAVSHPLTAFVMLMRGFSLGAGITLTYIGNGMKGIIVTLVLILPYALVSSAALVLAAREAARLSSQLAAFIFKNDFKYENSQSAKFNAAPKLYFLKFGVLTAGTFAFALLQGTIYLIYN